MITTLLITAVAMLGQAAASSTASVQGRICEVRTCAPISGARVLLTAVGQAEQRRTAVTDRAGGFRFSQLVAGEYRINVEADNFALASLLSNVTVSDGGRIDDLKIEMRPLGIISGRAFDETGSPLTGAQIEALAFRPQGPGYFRGLVAVASAQTDDRGVYRIPTLEPDDYYVRVVPPAARVVHDAFPATFYPSSTDASGAEKIVVEEGDEVSGIDLMLRSRGVHVRGRVVFPNNEKSQSIVVLLPRSSPIAVLPFPGLNNADQTDDSFDLRGIAPGSYFIYAITARTNGFASQWVRLPIDVADKDIENLTIPVISSGTIKGRIIVASDATDGDKLDLSTIQLAASTLEIVPGTPRNAAATQTTPHGDFEFARLPEMKMFLTNQILGENWFIQSARFDGNDALSNGFSTSPGQESTLEVVISNAGGTLAGVVKDRQEKPIPAGRIVLLPEPSRSANVFLIRTTVAIEKGAFTFEALPPGEYTAIAFPDVDKLTPAYLRDQQNIEKYAQYGQSVHIGPNEVTRMDLTVVPVP